MRVISNNIENINLNRDIIKFKIFLREYGHEVFLRILSKSIFVSFGFMLLSASISKILGSLDITIITLVVSILMATAYFIGKKINVKYTWIYQLTSYTVLCLTMIYIHYLYILDIDYKILALFFVFIFSIAIKNPYLHLFVASMNSLIGIIYFKMNGMIDLVNPNNYFLMLIIYFTVVYMNFRNYKALKAEFFEDQRYLLKSNLISSFGNRYEIDSFKNMVEESAINESLHKYKMFFDKTFNLYMIFDENNIYEINEGLMNMLSTSGDNLEFSKLREIIDIEEMIKLANTFENTNQKFKVNDREIFINTLVTKIEFDGKDLYMLSGYDNTRNIMISEKIENSLVLRENLVELNKAIIEEDTIYETLNKIINITVSAIKNASYGSVLIYDEMSGELNIECFRGYDSEIISDFKIKLEDSYIYKSTDGKLDKTVLSKNIGFEGLISVENILNTEDHIVINSTISSPLYLNGRFYGLVCVDSSGSDELDESDVLSVEYIRNQIEITLGKKMIFDEVKKLSNTDVLTGVFNRRFFEKLVLDVLKDDPNSSFHFVAIDLDNLKIVNDSFGHIVGDLYIKEFANTLKKHIRNEDYVVRYGGDEFVLIFRNSPIDIVKSRMLEISKSLDNKPIYSQEKQIFVKFSYGISSYPEDANTIDGLLKIADDRMYEMKRQNKTGVK